MHVDNLLNVRQAKRPTETQFSVLFFGAKEEFVYSLGHEGNGRSL